MGELTGIIASILTAVSLLPQVFKIFKKKKVEGFSLKTIFVLIAGHTAWIIYGIQKEDWIIICSNGFSVAVDITLIILAWVYRDKQ